MMTPLYLKLIEGDPLPSLSHFKPFKAVVLIEERQSNDWQIVVSKWLVDQGCLYMMAWGIDCSSWDDSVDYANLEVFNYGEIPDDSFVMTTWHEDESLADVFFFCKNCAVHPTVDLSNTIIVHATKVSSENTIIKEYLEAS